MVSRLGQHGSPRCQAYQQAPTTQWQPLPQRQQQQCQHERWWRLGCATAVVAAAPEASALESGEMRGGSCSSTSVAVLAPAHGTAPTFRNALPPALRRGSGPTPAKGAHEATQWPHERPIPLDEVPASYPEILGQGALAPSRASRCVMGRLPGSTEATAIDGHHWHRREVSINPACKTGVSPPQQSMRFSSRYSVEWIDSLSSQVVFFEKPGRRSVIDMVPKQLFCRSFSEPRIPLKGRERGHALTKTLYDLRHAGNPNIGKAPPSAKRVRRGHRRSPSFKTPVPCHRVVDDPGSNLTLVEFTLIDCNDSPEQLRAGLELVTKGRASANELGGSRHPTAIYSFKSVQVVKRKLEVLEPLVMALRHFEALCSKKETVVKAILGGVQVAEVGGQAINLGPLLETSVHKKPFGAPQDADRSDWESFVRTFLLPEQHSIFGRAEEVIEREKDAWMELVLPASQELVEKERKAPDQNTPNSPAAEVARSLFALCEGMGIPLDHPKLVKTEMLADAQRALRLACYSQKVLKELQGVTDSDTLREAAESVKGHCLDGINWGVKKEHPDMQKALSVSYTLIAEAVRQTALNKLGMKRTKIGEAEAAAQEVEALQREARTFGCPANHEIIEAIGGLILRLREEEGTRKRQMNAEMRKTQQQAGNMR